jgi:hypothetical protein
MSDQTETSASSALIEANDPLLEQLEAAIDGAYEAAPQGEGVGGALMFAACAALLVTRGFDAAEAVAKAIGERGNYGVRREYALVPRPTAMHVLSPISITLEFKDEATRDRALGGLGQVQ